MAEDYKKVLLKLPEELLERIDTAATEQFASRSEFIRQSVVAQLRELDEFHVRLEAVATQGSIKTEQQILDLLRSRALGRGMKQLNSDIRKGLYS